jgi:N-terminal domain of galactosyltransferase/Glycosyl transferase family 2
MKALAGVLAKDLIPYVTALARQDASAYLGLSNRMECLERAPDGSGFRCDWQWTSDLHAPKHLPWLGRWLAARALADHPIRRLPRPETAPEPPDVSFIIGHRGAARRPHLLATIESIAGQQGAGIECLVVEQEMESVLPAQLPSWVRHLHTPPPHATMPYCRSWAFNLGARHARGRMLILHDNDLLVSMDHAAEALRRADQGFDVVNLKRFAFYLRQAHTAKVISGTARPDDAPPCAIMQNLQGGGSIAITRQAYERIGGMDESFIGWGGEDNEFWERAQTLRVWPYGYLPLVHLWHPAQPGKQQIGNPTQQRYQALSLVPASERIERLLRLPGGRMSGPTAWPQGAA